MPISRLRPMPEQFRSLQPQARLCVLAFLRLPGKNTDYGNEAYEHLYELLNVQ